jgi:hypothetical protein
LRITPTALPPSDTSSFSFSSFHFFLFNPGMMVAEVQNRTAEVHFLAKVHFSKIHRA